jgi:hypothetical protein
MLIRPLLTRKQIATRWRVDVDAVSALIASKQLPAVNVARDPKSKRPTWRIRPEDLEAFELRRMTGTNSPATRRKTKRPTARKSYF